ncbi:DUF7573 domain-containing protein [Haloferax prahovense]|uniref:DUF7573 domain-containing protein n=1 Tax=Haloferax prahovense TaxID=381852 RepID=UPI003C71C678
MPNRSLDDFAGGDDGAVDDADSVDGSDSAADPVPTDTAAPADESTPVASDSADASDTTDSDDADADSRDVSTLATYRWTPKAAACPRCGESVQKRWLDGDEYVCLDCKDW